jgi:tRNA threonylcarbamoyladenosine biosynthesis protein TsaB
LHDQGTLLASTTMHVPQSTASQLSVMIDNLAKITDRKPNELKAIAVSAGPGSYTGLRIGVATAKGLCFGLGIPLIAVNSLDLLAAQVNPFNYSNRWLCPMFDARRMEVYTRLYDQNLRPLNDITASIIEEGSFAAELANNQILFFGNGAEKCKSVIKHKNASFLDGIHPSAEKLGELAFEKFKVGQFEDVGSYEPFYLKDFIVKKPKMEN